MGAETPLDRFTSEKMMAHVRNHADYLHLQAEVFVAE